MVEGVFSVVPRTEVEGAEVRVRVRLRGSGVVSSQKLPRVLSTLNTGKDRTSRRASEED